MTINVVPDRSAIAEENARTKALILTVPWKEFFRSAYYALFGWSRSYTASANINFGNIAAGGQLTSDVSVTGARQGDYVSVSSRTLVNGLGVDGAVTANNVVTVRRFNYSAGAIDPAADDFRILVLQQ
jgi:hypothetical protein